MRSRFAVSAALLLIAEAVSSAPLVAAVGPFAFRTRSLSGGHISSEDFKGKIVILDVWATWCAPCRLVIPHLIRMQEKFKAKGVAVVGLSADEPSEDGSGLEPIKRFVKENRINYPIGMMDGDTLMRILNVTGADPDDGFAIPTTIILDRSGGVLKSYSGYFRGQEEEIETLVKEILASENQPQKKP